MVTEFKYIPLTNRDMRNIVTRGFNSLQQYKQLVPIYLSLVFVTYPFYFHVFNIAKIFKKILFYELDEYKAYRKFDSRSAGRIFPHLLQDPMVLPCLHWTLF